MITEREKQIVKAISEELGDVLKSQRDAYDAELLALRGELKAVKDDVEGLISLLDDRQ